MKKIISKKEREKKTKQNQLIVGIILVFLMVFSMIGFSLQFRLGGFEENINHDEKIIYNGFEFTKINDLWVLGDFVFMNSPYDVPDVNYLLEDVTHYLNTPLYIYSESREAENEITMNLGRIVQRIQNACIDEQDCGENLPLKDCTENFIIIKEKETSSIKQEENCVFIYGKKEELTKLTDLFLFNIIGVK